jgi:hypothetical protein
LGGGREVAFRSEREIKRFVRDHTNPAIKKLKGGHNDVSAKIRNGLWDAALR